MKTHNKCIFVENNISCVISDVSDGYIKGARQDGGKRIKLPHKNYTLLGIVDECINSPYAEEFSKEIVEYTTNGGGYYNYAHKGVNSWVFQTKTAKESMRTLVEKLSLNPTDYILKIQS